jgi:hypothetical protein
MSINSTSTTIFNMFLSETIRNTFADELEELYDIYLYNSNIPLMKLKELLTQPYSP